MLVTLSNFIWIWIMWLLFNWIAQLNGCLGCLASGCWLSYPALSPRLPDLPKFSISSTSSHLNSTNYDHVLWVYGLFKPCWLTHGTCTCFKEAALLFNVHLSFFASYYYYYFYYYYYYYYCYYYYYWQIFIQGEFLSRNSIYKIIDNIYTLVLETL